MSPTQSRTVGLIGLGLLGSAVATRLLSAGWRLQGFDTDPERLAGFAGQGGVAASSASGAAAGADVVVTCLLTGEIVRQAVFGPGGAAAAMRPGTLLADLTTCSPAEARQLAADLEAAGMAALDAPVSGSSAALRAGDAVMMVGGRRETVDGCRPLFDALARRVFHVGPAGAGATAKLVTNLVAGLNRLALAEGLSLGLAAGIEGPMLLELLREGAAGSRALDAKGERMVRGDFEPEARLAQHHKDVRLILELGGELGQRLPASALHDRLLAEAEARGLGDLDTAAIIALLRDRGD